MNDKLQTAIEALTAAMKDMLAPALPDAQMPELPNGYVAPFRVEVDEHEVVSIWDADNCGMPFELNTHTQRALDDFEGLAEELRDAQALAQFMVDAMNGLADRAARQSALVQGSVDGAIPTWQERVAPLYNDSRDETEHRFRVYTNEGHSIAVCHTFKEAQTWPEHFSGFKIVEYLAPVQGSVGDRSDRDADAVDADKWRAHIAQLANRLPDRATVYMGDEIADLRAALAQRADELAESEKKGYDAFQLAVMWQGRANKAEAELAQRAADLKTTRATIRVMDEGKARMIARIAELERAVIQPAGEVPEAAQQNGGLVRAALIDLMAMERFITSGANSFDQQREANVRFARARVALQQEAKAEGADNSDKERLLWALRTVRAIADLGRDKPLGDWYSQAVMVCGALKRVLGDSPEAIEAGTPSAPSSVTSAPADSRYATLQEVHSKIALRRDGSHPDLHEGMNKALNTIERLMLKAAPTADCSSQAQNEAPDKVKKPTGGQTVQGGMTATTATTDGSHATSIVPATSGSIVDDVHLHGLFGNMHPLSVECIISYIVENYIDAQRTENKL